jgi:DNA-binding IclR family transcriptional regulator
VSDIAAPAGPTARTVAVIDFLTAHPESSFTMSEISRGTGISKATLHDLVNALFAADYLYQSAERRWSLGSALIRVGNAAMGSRAGLIDLARPLMAEISSQFDVQCVASGVLGDDIVILARTGRRLVGNPWYEVGEHIPYAPPLGNVFAAWERQDHLERWLARGPAGAERRARLTEDLARVRDQGWASALTVDARHQLQRLLSQVGTADRSDAHDLLSAALAALDDQHYILSPDADARYQVDYISAPIFRGAGRVAMALNVVGMRESLHRSDIERIAAQLRNVADRLGTPFAHPPSHSPV